MNEDGSPYSRLSRRQALATVALIGLAFAAIAVIALLRIAGADSAWFDLPDGDFGVGPVPAPDHARGIVASCRARAAGPVLATVMPTLIWAEASMGRAMTTAPASTESRTEVIVIVVSKKIARIAFPSKRRLGAECYTESAPSFKIAYQFTTVQYISIYQIV